MKHNLLIIALAAMAVLMGIAAPHLRRYTHGEPRYQPHEIEAAKDSIALSLLGQLQLSVGDLMWLKSMEYLHVGVVQRMPTRSEEERGYRKKEAQNVAAGLGHTEGVNMVLDPERDWRGIFGEIERNVKPYVEGHKHDDPVELIPWYQLAVRLNPTLERLYTLGAFYLADFAHEPGEAREMLEAGIEANPYSFEIHGALGRLYVDFAERLGELDHHDHEEDMHEGRENRDAEDHAESGEEDEEEEHHHHIETARQAYAEAVRLLSQATELAQEQRRQMAANREIFDDFQNQVLGESFLYVSKAHVGLGQYDEAVEAADRGWETASQYKQRNLLRVQGRVAKKRQAGEAIDAGELGKLQRAGDVSQLTNTVPSRDGAPHAQESQQEPVLPVSVLAGIAPPSPMPEITGTEMDHALLADVRAHPYETLSARAVRLGAPQDQIEQAVETLVALRFVESKKLDGETVHFLTPPGLYVAMSAYGFDFWRRMEEEARSLSELGVEVDLAADASQ